MNAILRRWHFRPINEGGHPLTDGVPQDLQPPVDVEEDEATREIAKLILKVPNVNL
jgi:hypothetical protein